MACSLPQHTRRMASPPRDPLVKRAWAERQRHSCPSQRPKPSSRKLWCSPHRSQVGTPDSQAHSLPSQQPSQNPPALPSVPALPEAFSHSTCHPTPAGLAWRHSLPDCFPSRFFPRSPLRGCLGSRHSYEGSSASSTRMSGKERNRTKPEVAWAPGGGSSVIFNQHLIDCCLWLEPGPAPLCICVLTRAETSHTHIHSQPLRPPSLGKGRL